MGLVATTWQNPAPAPAIISFEKSMVPSSLVSISRKYSLAPFKRKLKTNDVTLQKFHTSLIAFSGHTPIRVVGRPLYKAVNPPSFLMMLFIASKGDILTPLLTWTRVLAISIGKMADVPIAKSE